MSTAPLTDPIANESTSIPSTSSMTAAARMIRASVVERNPRSAKTRAVIPTDVATNAVPMKIDSGIPRPIAVPK